VPDALGDVPVLCPTCANSNDIAKALDVGILGVRVNSGGKITEMDFSGTETMTGEADPRGLRVEIEMVCHQEGHIFRYALQAPDKGVEFLVEESRWPEGWNNTRWRTTREAVMGKRSS
jgi:hypothetical protein